MSVYVQFGILISSILLSLILLSMSLFLIDNDTIEESEEDYEIEIIDFSNSSDFDDNIGFNDFNFGNIDFDSNTDIMSECSDT